MLIEADAKELVSEITGTERNSKYSYMVKIMSALIVRIISTTLQAELNFLRLVTYSTPTKRLVNL